MDRDSEELFQLTAARLALHGRAGGTVSKHTLRSYKQGISALLDFVRETGAGLLRPPTSDWGHLYARWLEDQDRSPSTVRVRLAAARALYLALRWSGASQADPFSMVRAAPDKTEAHEKCPPYSQEELNLLLKAGNLRDQVAILLGAHGGLRVSEAATLTWSKVDLAAGNLRVRRGKGRKDRTVDLSATLRNALEVHRAQVQPQAPNARVVNLTTRGLQAVMDRITKRAGVPMRGFHALRHSAGTRLYQETGDLGSVADHLGHASLDTARRYAKRSPVLRTTVSSW
jgi:integrase